MSKAPSRRVRADESDWKHLLSVGGLLGAVALVLLLGALLRDERDERGTGAPSRDSRAGGTAAEPVVAAPDEPLPVQARTTSDQDTRHALAARVVSDLERLERSGWTRQLAAICEPDNVSRWISDHGHRNDLYVVPVTIGDRACFRVCWGQWSSADAARRAGLPAAVAARAEGEGRIVAIAEIVP